MRKDDFFSAVPLKTTSVPIEGIPEPVEIRELTAGQRGEMAKLSQDGTSPVELQCHVIVMAARDGKSAMFAAEDIPQLMEMGAEVIDRLSEEILKLSGLVEKKDES